MYVAMCKLDTATLGRRACCHRAQTVQPTCLSPTPAASELHWCMACRVVGPCGGAMHGTASAVPCTPPVQSLADAHPTAPARLFSSSHVLIIRSAQ